MLNSPDPIAAIPADTNPLNQPAHTTPQDLRSFLPTVEQIAATSASKSKRSSVHDLVHAFRAVHGFDPARDSSYPEPYRKAVEKYQDVSDLPARLLIESLSSPEGYAAIRQAGRMRMSAGVVSGDMLNELAREVRAAMSWRERFSAAK